MILSGTTETHFALTIHLKPTGRMALGKITGISC
jgi:hypothetical protein